MNAMMLQSDSKNKEKTTLRGDSKNECPPEFRKLPIDQLQNKLFEQEDLKTKTATGRKNTNREDEETCSYFEKTNSLSLGNHCN